MKETLNSFCRVACASKAAFKLTDGTIVIFDLSAFKLMLNEYPDMTSHDATARFIRVMDVLVEGFNPDNGVMLGEVQNSYAWLKLMRDIVSQIKIRVLESKRYEEMDRLDITKDKLYSSGH